MTTRFCFQTVACADIGRRCLTEKAWGSVEGRLKSLKKEVKKDVGDVKKEVGDAKKERLEM